MEGILLVHEKRRVPPWKKRYFVLSGQRLLCYSHKDGTVRKEYNIVRCTAKNVEKFLCGKENAFEISSNDFFLLIAAQTMSNRDTWVTRLKDASGRSTSDRLAAVRLSDEPLLTPSSPMIREAASAEQDDIIQVSLRSIKERNEVLESFRTVNSKLILNYDVVIHDRILKHGSVLLGIDDETILERQIDDIQNQILTADIPVDLRLLRPRGKRGPLKIMPSGGLRKLFRKGPARIDSWKQEEGKLDGNLFRCRDSKSYFGKVRGSDGELEWDLTECTVRLVHRFLAGRECCFLLSSRKHNILLQASSRDVLLSWMGALTHAIDVANGNIVGHDRTRTSSILESPFESHMRRRRYSDELVIPKSLSPQPQLPFVENLVLLQHQNRMVDAIQLMSKRRDRDYWSGLFAWALDQFPPTIIDDLNHTPLLPRDEAQLSKDIPRTAQWLSKTKGTQPQSKLGAALRLQKLRRILHAYIIQRRVDADVPSAYLQGMNGIAFVALEAVRDDEIECFRLFCGIVDHLLPDVFGISGIDDNMDSLVQTGQLLEGAIWSYLPDVAAIFESVGLPVFILSYKWFPTLFSDVSLTAGNQQLSFDTLMAAWDVCFLLGMEGVICVALALFSAAQSAILGLPPNCLAEDVSNALNRSLVSLTSEWLLDGVCVVLRTCNDSSLNELRIKHSAILRSMRSIPGKIPPKAFRILIADQDARSSRSDSVTTEIPPRKAFEVKNLDTGETYRIA